MFSHVMIGTNDLEKAKSFYDAFLGTLGVPPGRSTATAFSSAPRPGFLGHEADQRRARDFCQWRHDRLCGHIPEQADALHAAGLANGGKTSEDPPGVREGAGMKLYIAYLRDPDGNKICALHRMAS